MVIICEVNATRILVSSYRCNFNMHRGSFTLIPIRLSVSMLITLIVLSMFKEEILNYLCCVSRVFCLRMFVYNGGYVDIARCKVEDTPPLNIKYCQRM